MSTDLTTAPRAQRDQLADRTDVLDKVGVLRMLPDDLYVTTDMVAEFYQVPIDTVKTTVKRNREELDDDGLNVIDRDDYRLRFNLDPGRVSAFMLYPRRAVLRIGMLLRDSPIARQVRDYLLTTEESSRTAIPDISTPTGVLAMADMFAATARELVAATTQLEEQRPMVERAKTHAAATGSVNRQAFAREVIEWAEPQNIRVLHAHVFDFLGRKLHLFITGERTDQGQATTDAIRRGLADNRRDTTKAGRNTITGVLTPTGQEYAWDRIVRHIDANGTLELPRRIGGVA